MRFQNDRCEQVGRAERLVFLFELDSVRKTPDEVRAGVGALARALMDPRNCVVLTYNQLVDGKAVLSCVTDEAPGRERFVELVERGRIKICRFKEGLNAIKYLCGNIEAAVKGGQPRDEFVFSALDPFNTPWFTAHTPESNDRLCVVLKAMEEVLTGNDPELFDSPRIRSCFEHPEDSAMVKECLRTIVRLTTVDSLYVEPKPASELVCLEDVLVKRTLPLLSQRSRGVSGKVNCLIDKVHADLKRDDAKGCSNRSAYYRRIDCSSELDDVKLASKRVVDMTYNYVSMANISGFSFDSQQYARDLGQLTDSDFKAVIS